jgi:hypothetical protein
MMEALPRLERNYSGDALMLGDGYTTRAKHAYGDRQYYKRKPPTVSDQSTNYALLLARTSARAKCTYGETYPTIEAHLR